MIYHDDVEMRLECDEHGLVLLTNKRSGISMRAIIAGRDILIDAHGGTEMYVKHYKSGSVCAIEKQKSSLGTVVGVLLGIIRDYSSDEISQATGFWPSPKNALVLAAYNHRWTLQEVLDEVAKRGISGKWQFENGIGFLEMMTQEAD